MDCQEMLVVDLEELTEEEMIQRDGGIAFLVLLANPAVIAYVGMAVGAATALGVAYITSSGGSSSTCTCCCK